MTDLRELAAQLRVDSIRCTTAAGSGHPTSSMSAADLMAVLLAKYLRYDWAKPHYADNDRLIFSKGHACPLLYSMFKAAGAITDKELLTLRKFGSRLQGHPNPHVLPYVDVATGSLGQGLPIGVGMALNGKYLDKLPYRVWVVLGDSEMAEGSIWEAFDKASYYKLEQPHRHPRHEPPRPARRDRPRLERRRLRRPRSRLRLARHRTRRPRSRRHRSRLRRGAATRRTSRPAWSPRRVKGSGVSFVANKEGWHGKALNAEQAKQAIAELGGERHITVKTPQPEKAAGRQDRRRRAAETAVLRSSAARRRRARPTATPLVALGALAAGRGGAGRRGVQLDPRRRVQEGLSRNASSRCSSPNSSCWARPSAWACWASDRSPRPSPPSSRGAYDQIRMAAVSNATIHLSGSHAGLQHRRGRPVADGAGRPGHDAGRLRQHRALSLRRQPDAPHLVEQMVDLQRHLLPADHAREDRRSSTRPANNFPSAAASVVEQSATRTASPSIAAGITVHEALKAYDKLKAEGIAVRIIDAYSVKPIDRTTLMEAARTTGGKIVVVEDHWPEGGLGDAVLEAFAAEALNGLRVVKLAVARCPVRARRPNCCTPPASTPTTSSRR